MIVRTCSAEIWSAKAGSSGAGSTLSPDGWWVTSRFCRNPASSRSIGVHRVDDGVLRGQLEHDRDVAELEVAVDQRHDLVGALGQGHGQVGGHDRLAGAALGREDGDDPPAARSSSSRSPPPSAGGPRAPTDSATRRQASWSWAVSTGAASTSFTPERMACWKSSVESSSATRTAPTSGRGWSTAARAGQVRRGRRRTGRGRRWWGCRRGGRRSRRSARSRRRRTPAAWPGGQRAAGSLSTTATWIGGTAVGRGRPVGIASGTADGPGQSSSGRRQGSWSPGHSPPGPLGP